MKILTLSGSVRAQSSNSALLRHLPSITSQNIQFEAYEDLGNLPIFTPDLEGENMPTIVKSFCRKINQCDGLIIASPEYVHAIPGGLKNAIDWLVQGEEIVFKPVALLHASHRGDDMLAALRLVLNTVTQRFQHDNFVRLPLMAETPEEMQTILQSAETTAQLTKFIDSFADYINQNSDN